MLWFNHLTIFEEEDGFIETGVWKCFFEKLKYQSIETESEEVIPKNWLVNVVLVKIWEMIMSN